MEIASIIEFLKEIEKFKTCERDCRTTRVERAESDAEHTWHLALFLVLLEDAFEHIDFTKLLKIALIHDLPELYAGDTNPYRSDTTNKEANEKKAAEQLFSKLPAAVGHKLAALFEEYINQTSLEARIVKSADKLMPLIQNLCTNAQHSAYRARQVTYEEVIAYMDPFFPDGVLKELYQRLLSEASNNGVFYDQGKKDLLPPD